MANVNRTVLGGTVVQNPEISVIGQGDKQTKFARFVLSIARDFAKQGEVASDFITCVAFGSKAEFIEQNVVANVAVVVKDGRIQTGSYTDANGKKVYTTEVVANDVAGGMVMLNKCFLSGNLTKNPEVRYTGNGENSTTVCHFTIAVKRRVAKGAEEQTDFILCTAFGKQAEFISKNFIQGDNIIIDDGRIQTGSYTNKDGVRVFTTEVIVNSSEFGENKTTRDARRQSQPQMPQQQPQSMMGQPMPPQSMMGQVPGFSPEQMAMMQQMMGQQASAQMPQMQMPQGQPSVQQTLPAQSQMPPQQTSAQSPVQQPPQGQMQTPPAQPPVQQPQMPPQGQSPVQQAPAQSQTPPQGQPPVPSQNAPMGAAGFPFGQIPMGDVFH